MAKQYEAALPEQPAYMQYPGLWELERGPNTELLSNYLNWVADDDGRLEEAASAMDWYPPGFHGLLIARQDNPNGGTHLATLQLNFYHPDFPGDEGPHGHSRDAFSWWAAPQGTEQVLTRYHVIPNQAPRFHGLPVQERAAVAMCIGDRADGMRPEYNPVRLGSQLILSRSVTSVASLGSQRFDSTDVHHAGYRVRQASSGSPIAVSVHYKGAEENPGLNTLDGFVYYKGLEPDKAHRLVETRAAMEQSYGDGLRLAPSTMLYPTETEAVQILDRGKLPKPSTELAAELILGGLATVERLAA
ncbi:MAG TPA: hypothetical protein VGG13_00925 [Candidatus Saccharimonadales bacterium]|jgi:hypothetical protein